MTTERLRFAESVRESWNALDDEGRTLARKALARIEQDPISGVPLADPVKGYWSAREARVRIIYRLAPQTGMVFVVRISEVVERGRS